MLQQTKREIVIRHQNKESNLLRINELGVYEIKERNSNSQKKVFSISSKLRVRIIKTESFGSEYRFTVRFSEQNCAVLGVIQGSQQLQKFLKVIGFFIPISGFSQLMTVFKKTGEGAFAQVYEVITSYNNRFAVKCFEKKQLQKSEKSKRALHNEIEILKKMSSPYIVSYDYLFQTEKTFYLKMQLLQNTLKQKIKQKLLVQEQKSIMKQLIIALQEMKNKNVIHRDLKPQNIMFRVNHKSQEQCVIIDFGLSTFADANSYIYTRCGTPGFLAPEIANLDNTNIKQTCSADMFSLGCVFYKMVTGNYLFPGKTAKDVLRANRKCLYDSHTFQKLSVNEQRLLKRMLDPQSKTRITPEQALKEPYFQKDIDDNDQIPEQQCKIDEKIRKMSLKTLIKCMESIQSSNSIKSIITQAQKSRRISLSKDSCLTFDFKSKQNTENQQILKVSPNQNSKNTKKRESSQRKSRFSDIQQPLLI